jgi:hypothetical protein
MIVAVSGVPILSRYTSEKKLTPKRPRETTPIGRIRSHASHDARFFAGFMPNLRIPGDGDNPTAVEETF